MARPCRVLMRLRKPCFFFLRRLFGWNVRFTVFFFRSRSSPGLEALGRQLPGRNPRESNNLANHRDRVKGRRSLVSSPGDCVRAKCRVPPSLQMNVRKSLKTMRFTAFTRVRPGELPAADNLSGRSPHGLESSWRRGWDSNPRTACTVNGFRDRPVRPLRHLSETRAGQACGPAVHNPHLAAT